MFKPILTFAIILPITLAWPARFAEARSATGTATATVISPISVQSVTQLDFGVIASHSGAGQVTVTPQAQRQISGNVSMLPLIYTPASFIVTGTPNAAYTVTFPASLSFKAWTWDDKDDVDKGQAAGAALQVSKFTMYSLNLNGGSPKGSLGPFGHDILSVGATLSVPLNATPGHYHGLVPISVSYQ